MYIRKSRQEDIPAMLGIYEEAKSFMRESGNPNQWDGSYPEEWLLQKDIQYGNSYIIEENGEIAATFAFIIGEDPTYSRIENGAWLNNLPYGTVHRLAGKTGCHGIAEACFGWCKMQINNLRADTHEDNKVMQHLLVKNGFVTCGKIYLESGAERIAYQYAGGQDAHEQPNSYGQPDMQEQSYAYGQPDAQKQSNAHGQQNMHNQPNMYGQPKQHGFGIASMVLGIIAVVLFFSLLNVPLAILAIVFGIIQLTKKEAQGMSVAGIITGALSLILGFIFWVFVIFIYIKSSFAGSYEQSAPSEGYEYYDDGSYSQDFYEGYYNGYKDGYYDGYYGEDSGIY